MELREERLALFRDEWLLRPVYGHQRFLLHETGFNKLKVHVPTAGGKTLGGVLFALRDTFQKPSAPVRAIFTYPTNLLSRDQFERSIVRLSQNGLAQSLRRSARSVLSRGGSCLTDRRSKKL